ncbi:site-specific integrase (plasmid) [Embleya sp. NBC_00888]|uniref:tyrosine-type recombinase/integrase n=1 Tax=Embleya sp. NBC_00888 TaxID=2975960 RepID=UPI002F90F373|nr:site-specific integrase [Embleya sp. NBC_00888]
MDDIRNVWAPLALELGGHERFFVGCLNADHVRVWRIAMEAAGVPPTTITRRLNVLSSLHKYAAEKMDLPRNPVTQDDRPHIDKQNSSTSTPVLEKEEIQAVVARSESLPDLVTSQLLYILASRVSEMCAADVDDLVHRGRRTYIDLTRKENKERLLPLPLELAENLDEYLDGRTTGPLLLDSKGDRLDRHDVARMLTRLGKRAGVLPGRDLTPHVLRASRITHMLDDEIPLAEVQAFADHDNPATTIAYNNRRRKDQRNQGHVDAGATVLADVVPKFRRA